MSFGRKLIDFIAPPKDDDAASDNGSATYQDEKSSDAQVAKATSENGNGADYGARVLVEKMTYARVNLKAIADAVAIESVEWNNLLKRSVKTILARRNLKAIDETTLPKIAEDLAMILEASGVNIDVAENDVKLVEKALTDSVSQNRRLIEEHKNKKNFKIAELRAQLQELEREVEDLEKIIQEDARSLNESLSELHHYVALLNLARQMKTQ